MAKLRFSNLKNRAEVFEANDLDSFTYQAKIAARIFRIATERRVHRGEIHKTVSWFESAELQVYDENHNQWCNLGEIKQIDNGLQFFEPMTVELPWMELNSLDELQPDPRVIIRQQCGIAYEDTTLQLAVGRVWQICIDTWRWGDALNLSIMQLGDELSRKTEREK